MLETMYIHLGEYTVHADVQFQKISMLHPQKGLEFPGGWGVL